MAESWFWEKTLMYKHGTRSRGSAAESIPSRAKAQFSGRAGLNTLRVRKSRPARACCQERTAGLRKEKGEAGTPARFARRTAKLRDCVADPPPRCVEAKMKKVRPTPSHPAHVTRIGTAGWTLPKLHAQHFPAEGTHLERCSRVFNCAEINSSFHRPHQRKTWERWAQSTPPDFRFSVKIPKTITHSAQLTNCGALLQEFFEQARGLGEKLGPLLVQLPPKLAFDEGIAHEFFTTLRELHPPEPTSGFIALEPRHSSWFAPPVDRLLRSFEIARVAAHPAKASPLAGTPGGWTGLCYWRLHGAPRTYYSAYDAEFLQQLAEQARSSSCAEQWVIFDNTALGHATGNALELQQLMQQ